MPNTITETKPEKVEIPEKEIHPLITNKGIPLTEKGPKMPPVKPPKKEE